MKGANTKIPDLKFLMKRFCHKPENRVRIRSSRSVWCPHSVVQNRDNVCRWPLHSYLSLDISTDLSVVPGTLSQQAEHRCQPLLVVGTLLGIRQREDDVTA